MKLFTILIVLLFNLTFSCGKTSENKNANNDHLNDTTSISKISPSLLLDSIKIANQNFKISDSAAIQIIKNVKEVQILLDTEYPDTTIKNDLIICDYPTNNKPFWEIELGQSQSKIDKLYSLLILFVNANSGEISILDTGMNADKKYPIEEWKKHKKNKSYPLLFLKLYT